MKRISPSARTAQQVCGLRGGTSGAFLLDELTCLGLQKLVQRLLVDAKLPRYQPRTARVNTSLIIAR